MKVFTFNLFGAPEGFDYEDLEKVMTYFTFQIRVNYCYMIHIKSRIVGWFVFKNVFCR